MDGAAAASRAGLAPGPEGEGDLALTRCAPRFERGGERSSDVRAGVTPGVCGPFVWICIWMDFERGREGEKGNEIACTLPTPVYIT